IRDFHVTGVQTCALPISTPRSRASSASPAWPARPIRTRPSSTRSPTTTTPRPPASSRAGTWWTWPSSASSPAPSRWTRSSSTPTSSAKASPWSPAATACPCSRSPRRSGSYSWRWKSSDLPFVISGRRSAPTNHQSPITNHGPPMSEAKRLAGEKAIEYVEDGMVVGVGTGSTVAYFIEALGRIKDRIAGAVSSSEQSTKRLKELGIEVLDANAAGPLKLYVDGADECDPHKRLIKGGGAALTREKIIAEASET